MAKDKTDKAFDIEVIDPEVARPKVLPLVVKPANGAAWKNPQQAKYAAVLNGYAYSHPDKWAVEKDDRVDTVLTQNGEQKVPVKGLLTKLREIGDNPSLFTTHTNTNEVQNEPAIVDKNAPNALAE